MEKKVLTLKEVQALLSTEALIRSHDRSNVSDPGKPELPDRRISIGQSRKRKHAVLKMRHPGFFLHGDAGSCEVVFESPDRTAPILFKSGILKSLTGKPSVKTVKRLKVFLPGLCQRDVRPGILCRLECFSIAITGKDSPIFHGRHVALPPSLLFRRSLSSGVFLPFVTDLPRIASGTDGRCPHTVSG